MAEFDGVFAASPINENSAILPLRQLDPACKLAGLFIFSICAALLHDPFPAGVALAGGALLCLTSRLPFKILLLSLGLANFFMIFLWIFLPVKLGHDPAALAVFGPFSLAPEGFKLALLITLKSNAVILATLALAGTSSFSANGRALIRLKLPPKLALLILLTHKHLLLLSQEMRNLSDAAKLRGFSPKAGLRSYRVQAWLVGRLLLRSWDRAERIDEAMRLRGFRGKFPLISEKAPQGEERRQSFILLAGLGLFAAFFSALDILF